MHTRFLTGCLTSLTFIMLTLSSAIAQAPAQNEKQGSPVAVEIRFITIADAPMGRLGLDFYAPSNNGQLSLATNIVQMTPAPHVVGFGILKDADVAELLKTIQQDRRASVMQSPKMAVTSGKTATIDLTEKQFFVTGLERKMVEGQIIHVPRNEAVTTGLKVTVSPVVAPDGSQITLKLQLDQASLDPRPVPLFLVTTLITPVFEGGAVGQPVPFTQYLQQPKVDSSSLNATIVVPDGSTMCLAGWSQQRSVARENNQNPVLSRIPYVNRLFKTLSYDTEPQQQLILVTARTLSSDVQTQSTPDQRIESLVQEYQRLCATGRTAEARSVASRALELDPSCFTRDRVGR